MTSLTYDSDRAVTALGVPGRLTHRTAKPGQAPALWFRQRWISEARPISGYGRGAMIRVEMCFDDAPRNGHNTFAITGDVYLPGPRKRYGTQHMIAGGCLHDEIAEVFPELAGMIRWYLCGTDGPMHYEANTVYLAGDRDHYGKRADEVTASALMIQFGDNPIKHAPGNKPFHGNSFTKWLRDVGPGHGFKPYDFEVLRYDHDDRKTFGPKFTFGGFAEKWHECPFDTESAALDFLEALQRCEPRFVEVPTRWSDGKARDLDAARRAAIWPDATDADLVQEPEQLRQALAARLPALLAAFRADIERCGFFWSRQDYTAPATADEE